MNINFENNSNIESDIQHREVTVDQIANSNFVLQEGDSATLDTARDIDDFEVAIVTRLHDDKVKDVTAIIKANDPTFRKGKLVGNAVTAVVVGGLHSVGRGCIGAAQREVVYYNKKVQPANRCDVARFLSRQHNLKELEKDVAIIKLESATVAFEVTASGLRKVINSGLPTLGKSK